MSLRSLTLSCLLTIFSLPAIAQSPNVVIIMADDLGFSDLGCYGGEIATPNLDRLADSGLRFTQFYNTGRCWPTRASLLTGYYAQQVRRDQVPGIKGGGAGGARPQWAQLLPVMLREKGYRSYHSGKWHIDGEPTENGFDHSYWMRDHGRYFNPERHTLDGQPLPPADPDSDFYVTTTMADYAIQFLQEHDEDHRERPFFLYLAFTAPHFPLHAEQEDIDRYRGAYKKGWKKIRQRRYRQQQKLGIATGGLSAVEPEVGPPYHFPDAMEILGPDEVNRPLPWKELTKDQRAFQARKMAIHAAMIDRMDREIGRVLTQLRAMDALDNTLLFFLSDNGASAEIMVRDDGHDPSAPPGSAATYLCLGPGWSTTANTPFRRHKTWVHEGGIATPLIVHWPTGIAARGELRRNPGHVIDLVPTILAAAGLDPAAAFDPAGPPPPGRNLLPAFARDGSVAHDYLWWYHEGNRALRVGDWKLVAAGAEGNWELYNLGGDRAESNDLANSRPDKRNELRATYEEIMETFRQQVLSEAEADK